MKKVMSLFCALFVLGLTQTFAQEATSATPTQENTAAVAATMTTDANEVALTVAELPAAVQTALQGEDYQGWTVAKAFLVKKDDGQIYKLILTQGTEERKVKLDAEGKPYKHADKKE